MVENMIKLISILLAGLVCESAGVVLLKKGINQIGDVNGYTAAEMFRVVKSGLTSHLIWLGIFFEALFFIGLLVLMAKSNISSVAADRLELCVCHLLGNVVFARTSLPRALGRRGADCAGRGFHQLQRTRRGKTGAGGGRPNFGKPPIVRSRQQGGGSAGTCEF